MSKIIEFFLGSILVATATVALILFSLLHYLLGTGNVADCSWHSSARAWIDLNHDGHMNNRELPLPNVAIHIDDIANNLKDIGWLASTDQHGEVQLHVSIPDCSTSTFEIYADAPQGFRFTTRPRIEVDRDFWGNLESGNTYYFGLISEK